MIDAPPAAPACPPSPQTLLYSSHGIYDSSTLELHMLKPQYL